MVQEVRILCKSDDLSSVPETHVKEEGTDSTELFSDFYVHTVVYVPHLHNNTRTHSL